MHHAAFSGRAWPHACACSFTTVHHSTKTWTSQYTRTHPMLSWFENDGDVLETHKTRGLTWYHASTRALSVYSGTQRLLGDSAVSEQQMHRTQAASVLPAGMGDDIERGASANESARVKCEIGSVPSCRLYQRSCGDTSAVFA